MVPILKATKWHNSVDKLKKGTILVLGTLSDGVLYLYQSWRKYLKGVQSYKTDTISILKFTKGHNSIKDASRIVINDGVRYFFSAYRLIIIHIVPSFVRISLKISEILRRPDLRM